MLLRLVIAVALVYQVTVMLPAGHTLQSALIAIPTAIIAVLLLAGVWTPIAGTLTAPLELGNIFARAGNPWMCVWLAALGISIAMIGPGAWSVDARLYGWRRLEIPERKNSDTGDQ